jgi:hypothetical protein
MANNENENKILESTRTLDNTSTTDGGGTRTSNKPPEDKK